MSVAFVRLAFELDREGTSTLEVNLTAFQLIEDYKLTTPWRVFCFHYRTEDLWNVMGDVQATQSIC